MPKVSAIWATCAVRSLPLLAPRAMAAANASADMLNASRAVASGFMLNGMIVLAKGADYTVFCNGQPENACALPAYVGAASRCRAIQVFRLPIEVC